MPTTMFLMPESYMCRFYRSAIPAVYELYDDALFGLLPRA